MTRPVLLTAAVVALGLPDKATTSVADIGGSIDCVGNALDECLAGQPVSRPVTRAYGCPIDY